MKYLPLFRMPTPIKITSRSSSITNAFINSIIPIIQPTENQVMEAFSILEMSPDTFQCSYCGGTATEWDHLRPLVLNKKPTGYVSEIQNLVPACGKCNQSKGNKKWREWMLSDARLSPKTKGVSDLSERIKRLEKYEKWGTPTKVEFEAIVGTKFLKKHWQNLKQVQSLMRKSQKLAKQISSKVENEYKKL